MKHKVHIAKREPPKCLICGSTNSEFHISYTDYNNPAPRITIKGSMVSVANDSLVACPDHVAEATAILLRRNNLIKENENDSQTTGLNS